MSTHKPITQGHCLIIPKRHVERLEHVTEEELLSIHRLIQKTNRAAKEVYSAASYLILQKNGCEVGQSVKHVHFHYIPRKANDKSIINFLFRFFIENFKKPISREEMKQTQTDMKKAIKENKSSL